MTILRRFAFPVLCIFYLVACNAAQTVSIKALGDTPAGVTTRFVFPTSGSNAEVYLTRPTAPGPFPLMILLHGHTFESIGGAESVVPEAEAFASDLCYAGLAVSLPGYGATEVLPGTDPKITLNVVLDAVSLVKKLPWIDSKRLYLYGFSRGAFFAALLANRLEGIEGVILHSGAYDLNRFYQDTLMVSRHVESQWRSESEAHQHPAGGLHAGRSDLGPAWWKRCSGFRPTGESLTRLPGGCPETLPLRSLSQ
jgi:pimeloyl-ACP methyl ester carboxylesterase